MNPGMMKPRPIEGAPKMPESPMPEMGGDAGYTGSEERCAGCVHFDGMEKCEIGVNGGAVEPMGHCSKFEAGEGSESESPEAEAMEMEPR
jgi:hypothetical protein